MLRAFFLRQLSYDLDSGLLFRPALVTMGLGGLALILPAVEQAALGAAPGLAPFFLWLGNEPGSAQVVLGTLASAMMTVISVVYSILLVALSLASVQFSTRILAGLMRDKVSQTTLGLFIGTAVYCLILLRAIRVDPPWVPAASVSVGVGLALVSLGGLAFFIHHIALSIQANHLVARLAEEAALVVDEVFAPPAPGARPDTEAPAAPEETATVRAARGGYLQLIDVEGLSRIAAAHGCWLRLDRAMGHFAPAGRPLFVVWPAAALSPALERQILACVDLGPMRTYQQDAEWGFRQIVDIALKAISPAVNDPSTAATCIDHLTNLLLQAARRPTPARVFAEGRVFVPFPHLSDLIDLSYEQLRQYGRTDMAVALRLLRSMGEVAQEVTEPRARGRLTMHARLLAQSAAAAFPQEDCDELDRRLQVVLHAIEGRSRGA